MMDLMLRRRELMVPQDTAPKYAVDRKTNAPLMDICYTKGWAANENYMTFEEAAEPITVASETFKQFNGISLYELGYFSNLTISGQGKEFSKGTWLVARIWPVNKLSTTNSPVVGGYDAKRRLVDFGEKIVSFHGWSFDGLNTHSIIIFRANNVVLPAYWDFGGNNAGKYGLLTIYVPDSLVSDYESSSWGQYGNTIKPLSEYDEKTTIKQILEQ